MNRVKLCLPVLALTIVFCGGRSAEAQFRASADWIFWTRNHDADTEFLSGAGDEADYGFNSGFRFGLGASFDRFDIEASFLQIPEWSSSESGTLAVPLAFDDPTNIFIAPAAGFGFPNALTDAANDIASGQDLEIEHLEAGARISQRLESRLRDFELNFGTSRAERNVWASLGWRHIEIDETSNFLAVGVFQAIDSADGFPPADPGDPDPAGDDGLSDPALTAAGFINIGGAGDGFVGYDPLDPMAIQTTLGALFQGYADNDLDGGQIVVGGRYQAAQLFIIEGFLKGGLFQNRATGLVQETIFGVENDTSVYRRTLFDRKTTASFAGSVGFRFLVPLTDYIFLRTGYEAMLVTNVALAADQPLGISQNLLGETRFEVQTRSVFIAHGGHLGLEVNW
jgi:hypothetical protein